MQRTLRASKSEIAAARESSLKRPWHREWISMPNDTTDIHLVSPPGMC
jgi:hypothetical protein